MACAAVFCVHEAAAAARQVGITNIAGAPFRKVYLPGTDATQDVCVLGQHGAVVGAVGDETSGGTIFFGEGDSYWTYLELRPDSCAGCGDFSLGTISAAHLALYFPAAPETVTVSVSVVNSVQVPCHFPNVIDANAVICNPFGAVLICDEPGTTIDFAIPVPPGCGLVALPQQSGPARGPGFIGFEFVTASDTTALNKPQIAVQAQATNCMSWNPVGFIPYDFVTEYVVGNPVMYADISRCDSVPIHRSTWGQLKMHYR
jgi:hypothetical protein